MDDSFPVMSISTSVRPDGFVIMDNPLPIFQKLFPDLNVSSMVVTVGDRKVQWAHDGERIQFDVKDSRSTLIEGR